MRGDRAGGAYWRGDLSRVGEHLTAALGPRASTAAIYASVFARWEELVGAPLAAHSEPLRAEGSVLVVGADHGAWASELRSLRVELARRAAAVTGGAIERVEVVGRPATKGQGSSTDR